MIEVKKIKNFEKGELEELTSATMNAIQEGIGSFVAGEVIKGLNNDQKNYKV